MTNDDVVFGGDDPTNDMQQKVAGVQGATDHGNNRMDGQRRTPLLTTIVTTAYNEYYFSETLVRVLCRRLLFCMVVFMYPRLVRRSEGTTRIHVAAGTGTGTGTGTVFVKQAVTARSG